MRAGARRGARSRVTHILAVWSVVTGVSVTLVSNNVLPWLVELSPVIFQAYHYVVGPGLLVLCGAYVGRRSTRPWVVSVGTVLLLWAVTSVALGCPGVGCRVPAGHEYWRNIEFAFDIGLGGPRLLVSAAPEPCAFSCPHKLQLVPLALGYGALAIGLSTPRAPPSDSAT